MSNRRKPRQHEKQTVRPEHYAYNESGSTPGRPPIIPPSPPNTNYSQGDKDKNMPWWKNWTIWKRIFEVIGIAAAVAYAVVTWLQWRDLRRNFETEERPWIEVKIATDGLPKTLPRELIEKSLRIPLEVTNIGKTPARDIQIYAFTELVDYDKSPNLVSPNDMSFLMTRSGSASAVGIMFPSEAPQTHVATRINQNGMEENVTAGEWELLDEGKKYIAVYGLVTYQDTFGSHHWTTVCNWRGYGTGTAHAMSCALYNNADKNQ